MSGSDHGNTYQPALEDSPVEPPNCQIIADYREYLAEGGNPEAAIGNYSHGIKVWGSDEKLGP